MQPAHDEGEDAQALRVEFVDVVDGDNHAAVRLQSFEVGAEGGSVVDHLVGGERRNGARGRGGPPS